MPERIGRRLFRKSLIVTICSPRLGMWEQSLASLARAWRKHLGLSQKELADKMDITQAALSQMESGEKKLRKATLEKLAAALELAVEQLRE